MVVWFFGFPGGFGGGSKCPLKCAVADFPSSIVNVHVPVPLQSPLQRSNVKPFVGVARSSTTESRASEAWHCVGQSIA